MPTLCAFCARAAILMTEVGINFGVYGVPETFVIDKKGVIRYKQIGPITPEAWDKKIHPLINQLKAE